MDNNPPTSANAPRKPLTEPADLFRLLGRFGATVAAFLIAVMNAFMQRWDAAAVFAIISLILQFWTIVLWRRLRDERMAAKAALAAQWEAEAQTQKGAIQ